MQTPPAARKRTWPALLALLLLTLVFFQPVIFTGRTFLAFDTLLHYLPWSSLAPEGFRANNPLITDPLNNHYLWHLFISRSLAAGELPLWDPANFCGLPFATGYTPHGNPLALLLFQLFPATTAHDLLLGVHLLLAGLFMHLYLRQLGLGTVPALIGAVSWMFKGYVMVFFEIESTVIIAASLPAALFFVERWTAARRGLDLLGFTGAVAVAVSSGYTHLIISPCLRVGAQRAWRLAAAGRGGAPAPGRRDLLSVAGALVLGIFLAANFVTSHLPFLEDPQRTRLPFSRLYEETGQLPAAYLVTALFPDFFGSPAGEICFTPMKPGGQPYNNYSELCIYAGVMSLFLLLVSLLFPRREKAVLFFALAALTTLTMAMGSVLYYPLAAFVPGLNFSTPTRVLYIFGFCVSVLAATGADILGRAAVPKKPAIVTLWLLVAAAAAFLFFFARTDAGLDWALADVYRNWLPSRLPLLEAHFSPLSAALLTPVLLTAVSLAALLFLLRTTGSRNKQWFLCLCLLILVTDLIPFGWRYNTASPENLAFPATGGIDFLQGDDTRFRVISFGRFMHNGLAPFRIEDVGGYNSFYPKRYGEYLHLCQFGLQRPMPETFSRWISFERFGSALFDLINVKYLLLPPLSEIEHPKLKRVYRGEIQIFENREAFPRLFFVPGYRLCADRGEALRTMASLDRGDFERLVVLESPPPADFLENSGRAARPEGSRAVIDTHAYRPNRIELTVSAPERGFLVIGDSYYPGWEADIDGRPAEVLRANYIMRALPVPEGTHEVRLRFRPALLRWGMIATAGGWLLLFSLIAGATGARALKTFRRDTRSGASTDRSSRPAAENDGN